MVGQRGQIDGQDLLIMKESEPLWAFSPICPAAKKKAA